MPRRQLPLTAGFFTPGGFIGWKSWEWIEWLDGLNVWWKCTGTLVQPLESLEMPGEMRKTKTPPAAGAGGVLEKIR